MVGYDRVGRHARTWDATNGSRDPDVVRARVREPDIGYTCADMELEGDAASWLPIPADAAG